MSKTIIISSDHAGYSLKKKILEFRFSSDLVFKDLGPFSEESVDYPDFTHLLSNNINEGLFDFGILICGSGIGMSIVANRYKNVRAALCSSKKMAKLSRQHNNANILVLGSRLISDEEAIKSILTFLSTEFEGGRHQTRLQKINGVKN